MFSASILLQIMEKEKFTDVKKMKQSIYLIIKKMTVNKMIENIMQTQS